MSDKPTVSYYLDIRRAKKNGKFPVRLQVHVSNPRRHKYYSTKFEFTTDEFHSTWNTTKPRAKYKDVRNEMLALELKAKQITETLIPFSFEGFEKKLLRKAGDEALVSYQYEQMIEQLTKRNQVGTADTYNLSQKSFADFQKNRRKRAFKNLTLKEITPDYLQDYEQYMIEVKDRSLTTVSIYVRSLRAIFNKAIAEKEIEKDFYPFGKRKYQVPATKKVKKALSNEQLATLYNSEPKTKEQEKAKDFWFFSFACNGMNLKDIALLKYKDISDNKIEFYRAKTLNTSKANLKPITVYLNTFSNGIIDKHGNQDRNPENFVFGILRNGLTAKEQQLIIKNFTRFINQHLKILCINLNLPLISSYWARHSYATSSVRKGASLEFIQESLGHGNLSTTQNYFAGFDDEQKKEFSNNIMDFES